MTIEGRARIFRYGYAVVAIVLAVLLRKALDPVLGERSPYSMFLIAIAFTAWYGGLWPAIFALVLSWFAADWFILSPHGSVWKNEVDKQVGYILFIIAGQAIAFLGGGMRSAQERAEEALEAERAQREELRVTLQSLGEGVIIVGADGLVTGLNTVAEQLTGIAVAEALDQPLKSVFHIVDEKTLLTDEIPVASVLREALNVRPSSRAILLSKKGSARSIEYNRSPIKDEEGTATGVVITFRDVTERRLAEERFARFMQHLPGLAWIKDLKGRYIYVNAAAENAFATSRERLYGKTDEEVFPAETAVQFRKNDLRALSSPTGMQVIETMEHEDGVIHHSVVSKFPIPGPSGEAALVGGMAIDITDLKRAEKALRESEAQFRSLADSIPQLAWMARPDGSIFWFNKRWYEYTGATANQMIGWGWQSVFDPVELPSVMARFKAAIASGGPWEDTFRLKRRSGEMRWHLSRALPVRDEAGRVVRWFGTNTDISDRMRMEEALKGADRRKDEFLATLAHELRNPLAPIRNALYLMRQPAKNGRQFEVERAIAERQVAHLARLIDDLMDVARITQGKIELRKKIVDLTSILRRAAEAARWSLEKKGHHLTLSLPDAAILMEADPTRIEQVFGNLLINAAKYTEPGGQVRLSAAREDSEILIRVRDTGVGIDARMLPHIFEMFVQAGQRNTRAQGGLGIGLSLVKTFVEMHGGQISVSSEGTGRGSEFCVRLPVLPSSTVDDDDEDVEATGPSLPRHRILVVDDNLDLARTMALMLERSWGQEVEVVHNGSAALDAALEFRPDVILLDIGLPGMDGNEVARRLRQQPECQDTVIVAMTGWGQDEDRRRSQEAGFDYHLVKPVDPEDLQKLLAEIGVER